MNIPEYNQYGNYAMTDAIVFVGGYGDDKDYYNSLLTKMSAQAQTNIFSFSFRDGIEATFRSQITDLTDFCIFLIQKRGVEKISIICTSDGAASATFVLIDGRIYPNITKVLFLDPAIYYLDDIEIRPQNDWKGFLDFAPQKKMYGEILNSANFDAILHVIHFSLRNYSQAGYKEGKAMRGEDTPGMYPRMNKDSIVAFYKAIPTKNRGIYKEVNSLPHAFMRDGAVGKNIETLLSIISELL